MNGLYECQVDKSVDCAGVCSVNLMKLETMSNGSVAERLSVQMRQK